MRNQTHPEGIGWDGKEESCKMPQYRCRLGCNPLHLGCILLKTAAMLLLTGVSVGRCRKDGKAVDATDEADCENRAKGVWGGP